MSTLESWNLEPFRYKYPKKKFYTDLASVLFLTSTFTGTVTLGTQFILPKKCEGSDVQALLIFASQFFLASPIGLVTIYIALHGYSDNISVRGYRHNLIISQFILVGFVQCIGYLSISIAILRFGGNLIGPGGLLTIGTFIITMICWGGGWRFGVEVPSKKICHECGDCEHLPDPWQQPQNFSIIRTGGFSCGFLFSMSVIFLSIAVSWLF
jgi:hypothetical protein